MKLRPSTQLNASGTADSTTFLRGDDTWAVPSGSGSGGVLPGWSDFVADYGADPTGAADCTAALQAWITDHATTGGTLYVPEGIYLFSAAQTAGTASGTGWSYSYSGQVLLPAVDSSSPRAVFRIVGDRMPTLVKIGPTGTPNEPASTHGSIFRTTGTSGNFIDAIPAFQFAPTPLTNVILEIEDLTVRVPNNPAISAIKAVAIGSLATSRFSIEPDAADQAVSQPTNTGQVGIYCPGLNNQAHVRLTDTVVQGCYTAVRHSEHAYFDRLTCQMNAVGIQYDGSTFLHAARYQHVLLQWNIRHIKSNAANGALSGSVVFESKTSGGWWITTYDVDDASSYLHGPLLWSKNGDPGQLLLRNGAENLSLTSMWTLQRPVLLARSSFGNAGSGTVTGLGVDDVSEQAWTNLAGTTQRTGGRAKFSAGTGELHSVITVPVRDIEVESYIQTSSTANRTTAGLYLRASDNTNGLQVSLVIISGLNQLMIEKISAGAYTTLGTAMVGALTAGTEYHVRVRYVDGTIGVWVDGGRKTTVRLSAADAATYNGTSYSKVGLRVFSGTGNDDLGSSFDEFTVRAA